MIIYSSRLAFDAPGVAHRVSFQERIKHLLGQETECGMELCAGRHHETGPFSDNPDIDAIDHAVAIIEQASLSIQSLRVPIGFDTEVDSWGEEISAVDGWTDLAGYLEIPRIRFSFCASFSLEDEAMRESLTHILDYTRESRLPVSIDISGIDGYSWRAWLDETYPNDQLLGFECPIPYFSSIPIASESPKRSDLESHRIHVLSISCHPDLPPPECQSIGEWHQNESLRALPLFVQHRD